MVELMPGPGIFLMQQAVLAASERPLGDESS
jgi:hypothetical protein